MNKLSRYALAVLFVTAGTMHLIHPTPFLAIVPPQIPKPALMVALSGVAELTGGVGVLFRVTRPFMCWGLIVLLISVFPANIYMAQHHIVPPGMSIPAIFLWIRLPIQPLLIWWAYETGRERRRGPNLKEKS